MNITIDKIPECKVSARVELPSEDVEKERDQIIRAFGSQARIPGYRPGKTPRKVVEKRFAEKIVEELNERLVRKGCQEVMQRDDLEIIGVGKVDEPQVETDGSFTFTAEFITKPEFELPEYKGIPIEVPRIEITDEKVDNVLNNVRERFAQFEDIEDRPLQIDDYAIISYETSIEGQPLEEFLGEEVGSLAKNEDYWLKLEDETGEDGSPTASRFLPGFVPQLVGLKKDDKKDIPITLADDFGIEKLQGKEIVFATEIKGIKQQNLPELDDELAGKIEPGKTLEELRTTISDSLRAEQENQREELKSQRILEHLSNAVEFELPEHAVNDETQRQVDAMVRRGQQQGMNDEQIMEHQAEIMGNSQSQARINVKNTFMLQEIARKEEVNATEDEIKHEVALLASNSKRPVKKVVKELRDNNGFGDIQHRIVIRKTLEFLKENASVTEVDPVDEAAAS